MRNLYLAIILTGTVLHLSAQNKVHRLKFLDDTLGRMNTFLYGQVGYNLPAASNYNMAGYGWQFSGGVNLLSPFAKKATVGVFVSLKMTEFLKFLGHYNSDFTFDFRNAVEPGNGYEHDSILMNYFAGSISTRNQGGGAIFGIMGVYLAYPKRYLPMIKVYRATVSDATEAYEYDGVYQLDFLHYGTNCYYGASLSWSLVDLGDSQFTITPYYMRARFNTMNLEGLWMHEFLAPWFNEKYKYVWRAGITLSLEFY